MTGAASDEAGSRPGGRARPARPAGRARRADARGRADPVMRALVATSVGATVGLLVFVLFWDDAPFAFTFDDAYYYFGIARNFADGAGSTFDRINQTNGYHPLWMLISTVPFRLGLDDLDAARALLALQLVIGWGATLLCISRIVSRALRGWEGVSRREPEDQQRARTAATALIAIILALIAVNPFVVKVFVNGMETGISVVLLALLVLIGTATTSWLAGTNGRWRVGVGGLLALTFLARTDTALLIGCLALWCAGEWWAARSRSHSASSGTRSKMTTGAAATGMAQLFGPPAVTIAVYMYANQQWFGTPFQVSGLVKRAPLNATTIGLFALFVIVAAFIGIRGFRAAHRRKPKRHVRFVHAGGFAARTAWFGAFCVLVVGYYGVLQTQIWLWYFAPLVLYGIILLLLAIADMIESGLREGRPETSPARLLGPVAAIFMVPLLVALVIETKDFRDPNLLSIQKGDRDTGRWIRSRVDESAVIASWDAGAIGYFSHRRVVNIDGLVNSNAYYEAMRRGTSARFLACEGISYVANHGDGGAGEDPSFRQLIKDMYGPDVARDASVVYRQPFLYSGSTTGSNGSQSGPREQMAYVYKVGGENPRNCDT